MSAFDSEKALAHWLSGWYSPSLDKEIGFKAGYDAAVRDYWSFVAGNSEVRAGTWEEES